MAADISTTAARTPAASPLSFRDFRVLWFSTVLSGMGYIGETVVLGWLLLERTDSALVVAIGIAVRALPNLVIGLPAGALADRVDRRSILKVVGFTTAFVSVLLAILAFAGLLTVWQILLLTFLGGGMRAVGQTARQSYAFDIVGPGNVARSSALMTLGQRIGGIGIALAMGGVLAELGAGTAYLLLATCHLLSSALLFLARHRGQSAPVARPPVLLGLREFQREISRNGSLRVLVGLTAAVEVLGFSHQAVLPSLARDVLGVGAEGLGLLNAGASLGAVIAVLGVSVLRELRHKGLVFLLVLVLFGVALVGLGSATSLMLGLIAVAFVSGLAALSDLLTQSLLQSVVPNDLRGRAMGSWILAIGLGPIGHIEIGALAAFGGVTLALTTNGLLLLVLGGTVLVLAKRLRQL